MAINIFIVEEDLTTIIKDLGGIKIDSDFYALRRIAEEENCVLVATIDDAGDTIINQIQLDFFKNEIKKLRHRTDVNQHILDQLQETVDAADPQRWYIKFMGD